jgi:hypothetical protein
LIEERIIILKGSFEAKQIRIAEMSSHESIEICKFCKLLEDVAQVREMTTNWKVLKLL